VAVEASKQASKQAFGFCSPPLESRGLSRGIERCASMTDLMAVKAQLETEEDPTKLVELLKGLEQVEMTVALLKQTGIGKTLGLSQLRKHSSAEVASTVSTFRKSWKSMVKAALESGPKNKKPKHKHKNRKRQRTGDQEGTTHIQMMDLVRRRKQRYEGQGPEKHTEEQLGEQEWGTRVEKGRKQKEERRTVEVEVRPLGGDSFKIRLDNMKPSVGEAKSEITRAQGTKEYLQELYRVAESADGQAVREDDAEAELLDDEALLLEDGAVVTMAVKEHANVRQVVRGLEAEAYVVFGDGDFEGDSNSQRHNPRGVAFVPAHANWLVTTEGCPRHGINSRNKSQIGHRVTVSDIHTGTLVCEFSEFRDGYDAPEPWGVAVTADSVFVMVAEKSNDRVHVLRLVVSADGSSARLQYVRFIAANHPSDIALLRGEGGRVSDI
jgi:hypothetical protein